MSRRHRTCFDCNGKRLGGAIGWHKGKEVPLCDECKAVRRARTESLGGAPVALVKALQRSSNPRAEQVLQTLGVRADV